MAEISRFDDLRHHYADLFGRAAAVYNLSPLLGSLYGYLLLSPDAMTLDELADMAGAAKSTVSVAMKRLEHYRVVRRLRERGDRRDYFVARTDSSEVMRELYQLFFSRELKYVQDANTEAREHLQFVEDQTDWPGAEARRDLLERLDLLSGFMSTVTDLLGQFLRDEPAQPAKSISIEVEE